MYEDLDEAIETLYNFRVAYLEDQIETAGFNIQDGIIVQDNYILFLPNFIFTLYGKPLAINVNQYGVKYARVNNTTIGFRKNWYAKKTRPFIERGVENRVLVFASLYFSFWKERDNARKQI